MAKRSEKPKKVIQVFTKKAALGVNLKVEGEPAVPRRGSDLRPPKQRNHRNAESFKTDP